MNSFLERSFPMGYNIKSEITLAIGALAGSATSSLTSYFRAYTEAKQSLYIRIGMDLVRDKSRVMPDFAQILGGKLYGMLIFAALAFIIPSAFHIAYHHKGAFVSSLDVLAVSSMFDDICRLTYTGGLSAWWS